MFFEECDDCISRQAAIDIVVCDILSSAIVYGRTEEGMSARKAIVDGLKRLPPVKPEQKKRRIRMSEEQILQEIEKLSPHDAYIRGRCDMWDAISSNDRKEILEDIEQILRYLEKARSMTGRCWIPVSERLPVGSDIVLLSLPPHIDPDGEEYPASVICGHYIGGKDAEWGLSDGDMFGYGLVSVKKGTNPVAWMPLPEPFEGNTK